MLRLIIEARLSWLLIAAGRLPDPGHLDIIVMLFAANGQVGKMRGGGAGGSRGGMGGGQLVGRRQPLLRFSFI